MAVLRIVHIFFAVFVAGYYMFMVPIMMPRLKRLGPTIQGPVMQALMPILTPVMMVSVVALVGSGVAMFLVIKQGDLGALFTSGWGWAIFIGSTLTLVAVVLAYGFILPAGIRAQKLAASVQGQKRPPNPDEAKQMGQFSAQIEKFSNVNFVLVVIVLLIMLVARYL